MAGLKCGAGVLETLGRTGPLEAQSRAKIGAPSSDLGREADAEVPASSTTPARDPQHGLPRPNPSRTRQFLSNSELGRLASSATSQRPSPESAELKSWLAGFCPKSPSVQQCAAELCQASWVDFGCPRERRNWTYSENELSNEAYSLCHHGPNLRELSPKSDQRAAFRCRTCRSLVAVLARIALLYVGSWNINVLVWPSPTRRRSVPVPDAGQGRGRQDGPALDKHSCRPLLKTRASRFLHLHSLCLRRRLEGRRRHEPRPTSWGVGRRRRSP